MLPKSLALKKSRSGLKILNLNKLLPSGKNRNYRKSRKMCIRDSACSSFILPGYARSYWLRNSGTKKIPSSFFLTTEAFVSLLYSVIYAFFHQHNHCIRIKFTKYPQYVPISSYHYWNRTYFSIKSSPCYSSTSFPSIYRCV